MRLMNFQGRPASTTAQKIPTIYTEGPDNRVTDPGSQELCNHTDRKKSEPHFYLLPRT